MASSLRVLVVDEDAAVLDVTAEFLGVVDPDLTVATETDPTAALDRVETEPVDVVVSDYRMPEMDGVELADDVCDGAGVPCLLYTAADTDAFADALDDSVAGHVSKRTGTGQYEELAELIRAVA